MNNYGQSVTFSTGSAPHLCNGACLNFRANDRFTNQIEDGEDLSILASILHSRIVDFSFDVKFDDTSTNFPDLGSAGAAIVLSALNTETQLFGAAAGGTSLISRAVETWRLGAAKTGSISGIYYPEVVQASPTQIATFTALTPAQSLSGLHPAAKLKWGTSGLTTGAGVVQGLTITQELQHVTDPISEDGKIKGVRTGKFLRRIAMEIMALTTGTPPTNGATLVFTGSPPSHATGYRLENVEQTREIMGHKMYSANAFWFTGLD